VLSVIPDVDILAEKLQIPFLSHRGAMHSIIVTFLVFLPVFAVYRKTAFPYFLALAQHSLVGDFLTGGVQLLWPLTTQVYGIGLSITSTTNILMEGVAFVVSIIIMVKTNDLIRLFRPRTSNLLLAIPTFTVLLPPLLNFPLAVPAWLIPPHLFYVLIFLVSMVMALNSHRFHH
jgi:membrane-bound metal-dependent hydrolase YbcI (DUF457 family)